MIIELAYIDIKAGEGPRFESMFPAFKAIMLSVPGGVSVRLLRVKDKPDSFINCLQWESQAAKDAFMNDPRLKPWVMDFKPLVAAQKDVYFDEIG